MYTIDGTVPGETGLVKAFTGQGDGDAVESDLDWSSIITFPQNTLANENLDTISYVDIIQDAVNEGWQLQAATHYTTRGLLQQMVVAPVEGYTQLDALTYGTDYTIQVVTAEDFRATLGEAYYTADGVGYVFKIVTFDQLFEGFSYDLAAEGDLSQFPDSGKIGEWAEVAMKWANGEGLIQGHENGTIDPTGTTIRAQAASILMRFDLNLVQQ